MIIIEGNKLWGSTFAIRQHLPVNDPRTANLQSNIEYSHYFVVQFTFCCALYAEQVTSVYISCSDAVPECVFFNYAEAEAELCNLFCHLMVSFHQPQEAEPVFRVVNEAWKSKYLMLGAFICCTSAQAKDWFSCSVFSFKATISVVAVCHRHCSSSLLQQID